MHQLWPGMNGLMHQVVWQIVVGASPNATYRHQNGCGGYEEQPSVAQGVYRFIEFVAQLVLWPIRGQLMTFS